MTAKDLRKGNDQDHHTTQRMQIRGMLLALTRTHLIEEY